MGNMKEWAFMKQTPTKGTTKRPVGRPRKQRFDDEKPEICESCRHFVTEHAPLCMKDLKPLAPDTTGPTRLEFWETSEGVHIIEIRPLAAGFREVKQVGVLWKRSDK